LRAVSLDRKSRLLPHVGLSRLDWPDVRAGLLSSVTLVLVAAHEGGYWETSWGWTAIVLLWVAALALVLRDVRLGWLDVTALGGLAALLGWTLLSTAWSPSETRSILDAQRTLVYVAAFAACLTLVRRASHAALLAGAWVGITAVAAYSLGTRLFPERLGVLDPASAYRLAEPIGYWNGLGAFAAAGALLAAGFAARAANTAVRAAAAASLVVLLPTMYFTFSRGAWGMLIVGLAVMLVLATRRLQLIAALVAIAPWPAVAVLLASRSEPLTRLEQREDGFVLVDRLAYPLSVISEEGHELALIICFLALGAALTSAAFGVVEQRVRISRRVRQAAVVALGVVVVLATVFAFASYGSPADVVREVRQGFRDTTSSRPADQNELLFTLSGGGRENQWETAWNQFREHELRGSGAGSYEQYWFENRAIDFPARDASNSYLELLAELGVVGALLLLLFVVPPLVAAIRARRSRFVPAAVGAYAGLLVHAALDWDWKLPVLTLTALFLAAGLLVAARGEARPIPLAGRLGAIAVLLSLSIVALVGAVGAAALDSADDALAARNWEEAADQARKAEAWEPWSSEPWHKLALAQAGAGDVAGARASLRTAIDKDPLNWRLWFDLAQISSGRAKQQALARARALNPLDPELLEYVAAGGSRAP
jgi:O-Antigen ligase